MSAVTYPRLNRTARALAAELIAEARREGRHGADAYLCAFSRAARRRVDGVDEYAVSMGASRFILDAWGRLA